MRCKKFRELMYLRDDELDAADASALSRHTSSCPACAAEYARVVSARKIVGGLSDALPHLHDALSSVNSVIGHIEFAAMKGPSRQRIPAFDRFAAWLSAPMARAAAAAMLLLIAGTFAIEYTSAYVTMKEYEGTFVARPVHGRNVSSAGAFDTDKLLNAVAYLSKKISGNRSYVAVSDSWVMIDKRSLEQLFLLYNELKENTPHLPAEFRAANPELSKLLETKQQPARIQITQQEREQLLRELNRLLLIERKMP